MLFAVTSLLLSAAFIYWACEYFVNAIEWVGRKAGISQNAVGTVLAAFGTALPESVVTFVAVVFGHDSQSRDIGVGAALGGPLVLATIAYPVAGIMLVITRPRSAGRPIDLSRNRLGRDQGWFLSIFLCKIVLGFVAFALKPALGLLFLVAFAAYTGSQMRHPEVSLQEDLGPLKFQPRRTQPGWLATGAQTVLALTVIFAASRVFVNQLAAVGPWLGLAPAVISLLLSPIATELPETMNAIIWIRQGKHQLALGNISGSMMIQATVPTALGLFFTPWLFNRALAVAAVVTLAVVAGLLVLVRHNALTPRRLAMFGLGYLLFAAAIVALWQSNQLAI